MNWSRQSDGILHGKAGDFSSFFASDCHLSKKKKLRERMSHITSRRKSGYPNQQLCLVTSEKGSRFALPRLASPLLGYKLPKKVGFLTAVQKHFERHFCFEEIIHFSVPSPSTSYRAEKKSWYVVARNVFLLLLNFSAWPCLGPA